MISKEWATIKPTYKALVQTSHPDCGFDMFIGVDSRVEGHFVLGLKTFQFELWKLYTPMDGEIFSMTTEKLTQYAVHVVMDVAVASFEQAKIECKHEGCYVSH